MMVDGFKIDLGRHIGIPKIDSQMIRWCNCSIQLRSKHINRVFFLWLLKTHRAIELENRWNGSRAVLPQKLHHPMPFHSGHPRDPRKFPPPPSRIQAPGWNADPLPIEVWDHRFLAFVEEARDPRSLGFFRCFFPDIWMVTLWQSKSWPGAFDLPMEKRRGWTPVQNIPPCINMSTYHQ